jgi:hypothetical protein
MHKDEDLKRVQAALNTLGEHFDTVQILATRHEPGQEDGTVHVELGVGNWFARRGQVADWLVRVDEESRSISRQDEEE